MNKKSEGKKRHGMALIGVQDYSHRNPLYLAWVNMRQRCNNPNRPDYSYYGERGIRHCTRWDKFENFFEDMGEAHARHKAVNTTTTLDRIDVNGNYTPENCRWATRKEQTNNRGITSKITYQGETKSLGDWVRELPINISYRALHKRIYARGWSVERAFTQPLK